MPALVASMWVFITSWSTPAVLFCFLNLMIGTIYVTSNFKIQNKQQQYQSHEEDDVLQNHQLVRAPSLLQRVKSINLSLYRSEHPDPLQPATHHTDPPADDHLTRSLSEPTIETPAKVRVKMKKSASEKMVVPSLEDLEATERQRPATVRERKTKGNEMASSGEDEEVDAKADDFINRFRQQLKLQRLDSIKEMFSRRSGK
ncbi:hypothetical protein F0562_029724 [Nyssa sinensis]|uniref:DUF4408 domain-containing protein n=1 Tax=Nyssa sinensis TaxID=561372 RepID=A0A5J5AWT6_9ASTE|nr:hypothetical protein F0562_029724 [Nyssa sinensis]